MHLYPLESTEVPKFEVPKCRKWTKAELVAYDAFLWSEEIRHLDDVTAIRKKRALLRKYGFASDEIGPWITEKEIIDSMIIGDK